MGLLWRLFAPRGLKRARRKVRRVAHPVRTAGWALSPKPVKQARRAAFKVAHPGEALEWAGELIGMASASRQGPTAGWKSETRPGPRGLSGAGRSRVLCATVFRTPEPHDSTFAAYASVTLLVTLVAVRPPSRGTRASTS